MLLRGRASSTKPADNSTGLLAAGSNPTAGQYGPKRVFEKSRFCHISPTMFPHSSFQTAGANPGPRTVSLDLLGLFKHPLRSLTASARFASGRSFFVLCILNPPLVSCRMCYSIGSLRGLGPSGKARPILASSVSVSRRSPAPRFQRRDRHWKPWGS
jgi:hypothetical protein